MLLALSREGCDVGSLGKSFCAPQTWKMVTFVYMGRFVNNLHCREDFWWEDFLTYLIGKSFCLPFLWRLSGRNFYYTLLSARGLPCSAGRNSSPGPDFWKLFPYDYRLKWKYIHPWGSKVLLAEFGIHYRFQSCERLFEIATTRLLTGRPRKIWINCSTSDH